MSGAFTPDELALLRGLFAEETAEHLAAIDRALGALEAMPGDGAALSSLLRRLHTLKGAAGTVELTELSRAAHELEERVVALRGRPGPPSAAELTDVAAGVESLRRRAAEAARGLHAPTASRTPPPATSASSAAGRSEEAAQIRVGVRQIDELMAAASELVMDRARIARRVVDFEACARELARARGSIGGPDALDPAELGAVLDEALRHLSAAAAGAGVDAEHLGATARRIEAGLTDVRMVDAGHLFARLVGPTRELARRAGREVEIAVYGVETAIDKAVAERVLDPLLHLLRNSVAHGIETPAKRLADGKPAAGRVELAARWRGAELYLEVSDDGAGVDLPAVRTALVRAGRRSEGEAAALSEEELLGAIVEAGVSTRAAADDLAGRGVGLDAVREAVDALGGSVACASARGRGARFTLRLPLTTAIDRGLLFKVGRHVYGVRAANVVATAEIGRAELYAGGDRISVGGCDLPLLRLGALLGEPAPPDGAAPKRAAIVLDHEGARFAITCDKLVGPRQIVVQGLGPLLAPLPLYAGATLSGAGKVQLLLDVAALARAAHHPPLGARPTEEAGGPRVLVCDDSRSELEAVSRLLARAGFRVETAPDGWEAWELLQDRRFDALVTDGEMPRLDGCELTAQVRDAEALRGLAVLVMSARESVRARAIEAGADAFLAKPVAADALAAALRAALASRGRRATE